MKQNRRRFIYTSCTGLISTLLSPKVLSTDLFHAQMRPDSKPWIELSQSAYLYNAAQISKMANGKPVVAVLKNNAYGLGDVQVAKILSPSAHIAAIAVVKDERALAIRAAGISKSILLMGDFDRALASTLVQQEITLSIFSKDSLKKVSALSQQSKKPIKVALYIDTGLGRMGIPYQEVPKIAQAIAENDRLSISQTFSTLTTPQDFAKEQIQRFEQIIKALDKAGISTGLKHLAPSYSILDLSASHQEAVRPGILLHGSFPGAKMQQAKQFPLQLSYRLKAPVIRLERLKTGDTIGFSRFYKVEKDEWIATLPIGWADGYNSGAENGAKVLLRGQLYPVVNVNASHANIALGAKTTMKVGDIATLIGPEQPEITPEGFGELVKGHNYLQINYKESISKQIYENF
ncbi:MAG: alanine racemase [Saprospiraceae bacterium]|nr:alanine racemase [Saprospiraceae bacterium]